MNKFEQVSGDGHQISLADVGTHILYLEGAGAGGGSYTVRSKPLWVMVTGGLLPVDRMTNRQTSLKTLPSRNFVGGR